MSLLRQLLASLATNAAAAGRMAFGTFEDSRNYFPSAVVVPAE